MNNQTPSQPRSVYYVFDFKGEDRVQLARSVAEAKQRLAAVYGTPTGTIPLGYVDANNKINLFYACQSESVSLGSRVRNHEVPVASLACKSLTIR